MSPVAMAIFLFAAASVWPGAAQLCDVVAQRSKASWPISTSMTVSANPAVVRLVSQPCRSRRVAASS